MMQQAEQHMRERAARHNGAHVGVIFATLHAQGYDGWYTFEWEKRWHPELAEPEIALPAGAAFVHALAASAAASEETHP